MTEMIVPSAFQISFHSPCSTGFPDCD